MIAQKLMDKMIKEIEIFKIVENHKIIKGIKWLIVNDEENVIRGKIICQKWRQK